jgi:hypothetical protein
MDGILLDFNDVFCMGVLQIKVAYTTLSENSPAITTESLNKCEMRPIDNGSVGKRHCGYLLFSRKLYPQKYLQMRWMSRR